MGCSEEGGLSSEQGLNHPQGMTGTFLLLRSGLAGSALVGQVQSADARPFWPSA